MLAHSLNAVEQDGFVRTLFTWMPFVDYASYIHTNAFDVGIPKFIHWNAFVCHCIPSIAMQWYKKAFWWMALGRMTHSSALLRARMVQDIYDIGHQKDYVLDMRSKISEASQLQWHSKKCLCFVSTPNNPKFMQLYQRLIRKRTQPESICLNSIGQKHSNEWCSYGQDKVPLTPRGVKGI